MGFFSGILDAVTGGLGGIVGGLLGFEGQKDTNETNVQLARETREFNAAEAEKSRYWQGSMLDATSAFNAQQSAINRDFQERMSNTAWQRAVGDMKEAGLNPMLAYSRGGAAMPSGGSASVGSPSGATANAGGVPRVENAVAQAVASAGAVANIKNIQADTLLKEAAAKKETATATNLEQQTKVGAEQVLEVQERVKLMWSQRMTENEKMNLTHVQTGLAKMESLLKSGQISLTDVQVAIAKIEEKLAALRVPEAEAYAGKWRSSLGQDVSPYLREILDVIRVLIYNRGVSR